MAFSVAFAIPTLVTGAIEGLIPSSPILVFVAIFIAMGIALAVRALSPTVVTLGAEGLGLQRGRAMRRIPLAEVKAVSRAGGKVIVDAGAGQSVTIVCAGPSMADAVTTRLRDALEAWQAT